jgi:hypothetical protein
VAYQCDQPEQSALDFNFVQVFAARGVPTLHAVLAVLAYTTATIRTWTCNVPAPAYYSAVAGQQPPDPGRWSVEASAQYVAASRSTQCFVDAARQHTIISFRPRQSIRISALINQAACWHPLEACCCSPSTVILGLREEAGPLSSSMETREKKSLFKGKPRSILQVATCVNSEDGKYSVVA